MLIDITLKLFYHTYYQNLTTALFFTAIHLIVNVPIYHYKRKTSLDRSVRNFEILKLR